MEQVIDLLLVVGCFVLLCCCCVLCVNWYIQKEVPVPVETVWELELVDIYYSKKIVTKQFII